MVVVVIEYNKLGGKMNVKKVQIIEQLLLPNGRTDSATFNQFLGWDWRKYVSDYRKYFKEQYSYIGDPFEPVGRDTNNDYILKLDAHEILKKELDAEILFD